MKIERKVNGTTLIVKPSGRLETTTAPELQAVIDNELTDVSDLNIDMEQLEYVSSAGLRVLLSATKKMQAKNGNMKIQNVRPEVLEVFKITGFDVILTIE